MKRVLEQILEALLVAFVMLRDRETPNSLGQISVIWARHAPTLHDPDEIAHPRVEAEFNAASILSRHLFVIYGTAASGVRRAGSGDNRRAIVRFAETSARTNNHRATSPTPASESHMIHSATVGLALLVKALAKPDRYPWLVASTAKTCGP